MSIDQHVRRQIEQQNRWSLELQRMKSFTTISDLYQQQEKARAQLDLAKFAGMSLPSDGCLVTSRLMQEAEDARRLWSSLHQEVQLATSVIASARHTSVYTANAIAGLYTRLCRDSSNPEPTGTTSGASSRHNLGQEQSRDCQVSRYPSRRMTPIDSSSNAPS